MTDPSIDNELERVEKAQLNRLKLNLILQSYMWVGVGVALVSSLYLALSLIHFELSVQQRLAVMIAGLGAGIGLTAVIYNAFLRSKREADYDRSVRKKSFQELLATWQLFETTGKRVGEISDDVISPNEIISALVYRDLIDEVDILALTRALRTRNELVHTVHHLDVQSVQEITKNLLDVIMHIRAKEDELIRKGSASEASVSNKATSRARQPRKRRVAAKPEGPQRKE